MNFILASMNLKSQTLDDFFAPDECCLNYCSSKDYEFVIVAEYGLGDQRDKMISLWNRPLTLESDTESFEYIPSNPTGDLIAEIEIGEGKDKIEGCFLKFSPDGKTLCIMIDNEDENSEDIPESYFCEAHFFKCHQAGNNLTWEKMFSFDAHLIGVCAREATFNVFGDKIVMYTESGMLIYSLHSRSVVATFDSEEPIRELNWSYDLINGEILIYFDAYNRKKIFVNTIDYEKSTLKLIRIINLADIPSIPKENSFIAISTLSSGT